MVRNKKIYLATGNEHGLAWQLSFNAAVKEPRWGGTFYLAGTGKLHTQRTVYLTGGVEQDREWELIINASAVQGNFEGNFYFK